jgi:hypothetical protein
VPTPDAGPPEAVELKVGSSPDYLDGRFFRITMLTDSRFAEFAQLAGGLWPEQFEELRAFVRQHVDGQLFEPSFLPVEPPRFLQLTRFMTWWTVAIEGTIALTFLWPVGRGLSKGGTLPSSLSVSRPMQPRPWRDSVGCCLPSGAPSASLSSAKRSSCI